MKAFREHFNRFDHSILLVYCQVFLLPSKTNVRCNNIFLLLVSERLHLNRTGNDHLPKCCDITSGAEMEQSM